MTTLTITVTEEDIHNGERRHCRYCPVALAADRALQSHYGNAWVEVGGYTLTYWLDAYYGDVGNEIDLPQEVCERIYVYDVTGNTEPFEFEVEIPD